MWMLLQHKISYKTYCIEMCKQVAVKCEMAIDKGLFSCTRIYRQATCIIYILANEIYT